MRNLDSVCHAIDLTYFLNFEEALATCLWVVNLCNSCAFFLHAWVT